MTHIYCFCGRELLGQERERAIKALPFKWNYSVVEYVKCYDCLKRDLNDPFQDAVPCFDWTPEAWKAAEWFKVTHGRFLFPHLK